MFVCAERGGGRLLHRGVQRDPDAGQRAAAGDALHRAVGPPDVRARDPARPDLRAPRDPGDHRGPRVVDGVDRAAHPVLGHVPRGARQRGRPHLSEHHSRAEQDPRRQRHAARHRGGTEELYGHDEALHRLAQV